MAFRFCCAIGLLLAAPVAAQDNPFQPFDREAFVSHASAMGATGEMLANFADDADNGPIGVATDGLLRALSPEYDRAVALAERGEPAAALALTKLLAGTEDAYLRAHLRYHLGRVFLDGDDPEEAAVVFGEYLRDDRNTTALDGEALYFYGHALAEIPDQAQALAAFRSFLEYFPAAAERYRASATQQMAELREQVGPLHEVADIMKFVERRIRKTDTGKETQKRQDDVIVQLQEILELIEEQERQSSGAPGGLSRPQAPAANSAAPPGATRIGNLNKVPGVADRWGLMKDRDREAIESDLQVKLPGRYRRMLEDYYRKLGVGGR